MGREGKAVSHALKHSLVLLCSFFIGVELHAGHLGTLVEASTRGKSAFAGKLSIESFTMLRGPACYTLRLRGEELCRRANGESAMCLEYSLGLFDPS